MESPLDFVLYWLCGMGYAAYYIAHVRVKVRNA